jgi:hypothetical protein
MYEIYAQFIPADIVKNEKGFPLSEAELAIYSKTEKKPEVIIGLMDGQNVCNTKLNTALQNVASDCKETDNKIVVNGSEYIPIISIDAGMLNSVSNAFEAIIDPRMGGSEGVCIIAKRVFGVKESGPMVRVSNFVANFTDEYGLHAMNVDEVPYKFVISKPTKEEVKKEKDNG